MEKALESYYYLAYGSNLNLEQMSRRCPHSYPVGKAYLEGYELLFKGSSSGNYLTIEKKKGSKVPVIVYKVTKEDINSLNAYEGYPMFYGIKKFRDLEVESFLGETQNLDCFAYIMKGDRQYGTPSASYYMTCILGYRRFSIPEVYMDDALLATKNKMEKSRKKK